MNTVVTAARVVLVVSVSLRFLGCAMPYRVARAYDGNPLPPNQEVVVKLRFPVYVSHVNDQPQSLYGSIRELRLLPGRNDLQMGATFPTPKGTYSLPSKPIFFDSRPGHTYEASCLIIDDRGRFFIEEGQAHEYFWASGVVGSGQKRESCMVVQQPASFKGVGLVSGVAAIRVSDYQWYTARNLPVDLVEQTEESTRWIENIRKIAAKRGLAKLSSAAREPASVKAIRYTVHTTFDSTFTFDSVPPGYYYVIFRGDGNGMPAVTECHIEKNEHVKGIKLLVDRMQ
jgi:hypothetical protein